MKQYWEEKLKRKLEGHRKSPPEGLWEGINEQMGLTPEPIRKPSAKRWIWSAAAALALAGFFAFYQSENNEIPKVAEAVHRAPTPHKQQPTSLMEHKELDETPGLALTQLHTDNHSQTPNDKASYPNPIEQGQQTAPHQTSSVNDTIVEETHLQHTESDAEKSTETLTDNHDMAPESDNLPAQHQTDLQSSRPLDEWNKKKSASTPSHQWSISLNASGGLLAAQTSPKMERLYSNYYVEDIYQATYYNSLMASSNINYSVYSVTDQVWEHHLPVRLGVELSRQLSPRLALQSGINYTYLYSQFSIPLYPNIVNDQKLHYLGIPIGLSYRICEVNRLTLYAAGGVMVEKCLNDKPWQWSSNASLGAEYVISQQFGFYVEPSLGYYFDDGTSLEHYYKEHPLTPSIELGLRLHLNK